MEPAGILKCFMRSVEQLNLRFINFFGDGDSKAYYEVVKANPYGDRYPVNKGECLGHIQKRVGSRLRKLKKEYGGKKLSDGKTLRGRLSDKEINKLQNYFGIAIRANCHSVTSMQKAISAVVYHCSEANDPDARHMFCDKKQDTWCKYQKAKLKGKVHIDKPSIPTVVKELVMPIFKDLSKPELLKKCLRGKTQNNECLNGVVWKRLPKDVFIGGKTLELGISSAVINFNDGATGFANRVMKDLCLVDGQFTSKFCEKAYIDRVKECDRKSSEMCKKARKRSRAVRKGFADKDAEKEGDVYVPGGF